MTLGMQKVNTISVNCSTIDKTYKKVYYIMLVNNLQEGIIMWKMFFVAIFYFTVGASCVEMRAEISNFFSIPVSIGQIIFTLMCTFGAILLFLFGFFYPIRIRE